MADVRSGEQVACRWVKLAVERHVRDLRTGHERGLYFDEDAAKLAIAFFSVLRHYKGEWAGQVIELEPWQQFLLWVMFGWKRKDGTRRFRTAYLEVARKNGKTTVAAGIGLYLMVMDNEPGAEIYTAATKRDQAKIAHQAATQMVRQSPELKREIKTFKDNLHSVEKASKFEPLGRDADSTDGLNIHGVIADEVHAWKHRDMWDVLETSTGSRRQPLMLAITTAGFDRHSFCWELHEYVEKLLDGVIEDDSFFGMIYTLDEGDEYEDEGVWEKANPNLGVSKKWDDTRRKLGRAQEMPPALNAFLRLELNIWTQAETRWVNIEAWKACGKYVVEEEKLHGRKCYGGLDLSSTTDVSALVYVFPPSEETGDGDQGSGIKEPWQVVCRFFIPEDNMRARVRRDRVHYDVWERHNYLTTTPGNVVDYDFILAQLDQDAQVFDIEEVAYDRWGATRIAQQIQDRGMTLVEFGQGFASMSGPTKELGKLIGAGELAHGNHPVLTWMADNLVVRQDAAENIKPDKEKSTERIDGMVALVMALDRALRHSGGAASVYEGRGILTI